MHVSSTYVAVLSASSLVSTATARIHQDRDQTPLIQPGDNFTLDPIRDALVSNKVIGDVLDDFEPLYYLDVVYQGTNANGVRISLGNEVNVSDVQTRPNLGIYRIPDHSTPPVAQQPSPVTFTVALTDPDAKSRYNPKWSEMCHWIVTNITSTATGLDFSGGIEVNPEIFDDDKYNYDYDDDDNDTDEETQSHKKKKKKHHHRNKRCKKDKKGGKCLSGELVSYFPPAPPPKTGWHRYTFVLLQGDATAAPLLYGPRKRRHWGYGLVRHGVRDWAVEYGLEVVGANFFFAENERQ